MKHLHRLPDFLCLTACLLLLSSTGYAQEQKGNALETTSQKVASQESALPEAALQEPASQEAVSQETASQGVSTKVLSPKNSPKVPTPFKTNQISKIIFNDAMMLKGYTETYKTKSKATLLAMIQDETVGDIKVAAAVRAFREKYALEIFSKEKQAAMLILLRKLNRADSAFIDVEIMHTLCLMDRYKYFDTFMPKLIQKLDHYNDSINESAYQAINDIIKAGNNRPHEARIVFNTLRNMLFLSRRKLANITKPDKRLSQKLEILKWSIKVLGTQELRRLPKEVLNLL